MEQVHTPQCQHIGPGFILQNLFSLFEEFCEKSGCLLVLGGILKRSGRKRFLSDRLGIGIGNRTSQAFTTQDDCRTVFLDMPQRNLHSGYPDILSQLLNNPCPFLRWNPSRPPVSDVSIRADSAEIDPCGDIPLLKRKIHPQSLQHAAADRESERVISKE